MKCPLCMYLESKVIDSRPSSDGTTIRRRRECLKCGKRFTTFEIIENVPLTVVKKDNSRERFDRNKILSSILRACDKRNITREEIERIVTEIEQQLQNSLSCEIQSSYIGELVMQKLKAVDEIAYIRFASVYRQFKDISELMDELKKLIAEK